MGFNELSVALHLRRHPLDQRGFFTAATISILFGVFALVSSGGSGHAAAVWLTWYGGMMAATHFWIAYRLRTWQSEVKHHVAAAV